MMEDPGQPASFDLAKQRRATMAPIAIAFPVAIALWFAICYLPPPIAGMDTLLDRLVFALKCSAVAILFSLVMGVEAVAHERLRSPAIDPLSGYETRRMRVNLRYLQNTLEQLIIFVPGLLGLAAYSADGGAMRRVVAATVLWIAARVAFWIGYHRSSAERGYGAPSMAVGMLMLLYVCARFGFELAGWAGAAGIVVLFGVMEAIITWKTAPEAGKPNP
jgi:MAPEG family